MFYTDTNWPALALGFLNVFWISIIIYLIAIKKFRNR